MPTEPQVAATSGAVVTSLPAVDALSPFDALGPYRQTRSGATASQTVTPLGAAPASTNVRTRSHVADLRAIATPAQLAWIDHPSEGDSPREKHRIRELVSQLRTRAVATLPWAATIEDRSERERSPWAVSQPHPGCWTCGGSGSLSRSRLQMARPPEAVASSVVKAFVPPFPPETPRWVDDDMRKAPPELLRLAQIDPITETRRHLRRRKSPLGDIRTLCPGAQHPQRRRGDGIRC
jgi:hypothetical protein